MAPLFIFLCLGFLLISLSLFYLYLQLVEATDTVSILEKKTTDMMHLIFASNVKENWEALESLLRVAKQRNTDLVILTNVFNNPLSPSEKSAYNHAYRHVQNSFKMDKTFSDIHEFIQSFRNDTSQDIVAVSAKKILKQIDEGISIYSKKIEHLKKILKKNPVNLAIVPGPFENLDLLQTIDREIASYYLNLNVCNIKNFRILGIGGLDFIDAYCPLYFQNRDYYEGTDEAHDELKKLLTGQIDLFVSFSPIRYFTDSVEEETNVRNYLCDHLPGKVILTSQAAPEDPMLPLVTATNADLIKGGHFGVKRQYWDIHADSGGLVNKRLFFI